MLKRVDIMVDRNIETERLNLKIPVMEEQYLLWNILRQEIVWQYYMSIPERFNNDRKLFQESLNDWSKQEKFFRKKIDNLNNDSDKYTWTIHLKDGTVIGQITVQPNPKHPENHKIRDIGWYIDPKLQGNGYAYEAAKAILDYMFTITDIEEIQTGANVVNMPSWKLMEKLGFVRIGQSPSSHYDKNGNQLESYDYILNRELYFSKNNETKKIK